jgi:hypothetical protein
MNIYIGFWILEVKCTRYGICGQTAFKKIIAIYRIFGQRVPGGNDFLLGFDLFEKNQRLLDRMP